MRLIITPKESDLNDFVTAAPSEPLHASSNTAGDYVSLVRHATLAASSHNTQPWKFKLQGRRVGFMPTITAPK
jgi:hypothetical protein